MQSSDEMFATKTQNKEQQVAATGVLANRQMCYEQLD